VKPKVKHEASLKETAPPDTGDQSSAVREIRLRGASEMERGHFHPSGSLPTSIFAGDSARLHALHAGAFPPPRGLPSTP
jgi:hypothetical protein